MSASAENPICPYCGKEAELKDSAIVYGRSYGLIWDCRPCDAYVGVHKSSPTHKPKGKLANRELRRLRIQAHSVFDPLWETGRMSRSDAYAFLARVLNLVVSQTHISWLTTEQCNKVIRLFSDRDSLDKAISEWESLPD